MKGIMNWVIYGIVALIVLIVLTGSFVTIEAGHVGVVKRLGAVQDSHLVEGFHFKAPFIDTVVEVDIRLRKAENNASAASKDLQVVVTTVAVQYSMMPVIMPRTFQRIGDRNIVETTVIDPAILESVKAVTAQYTAEKLVTERAEVKVRIRTEIEEFIATTLEQKDVGGAIEIANVAITDFLFTDEFNQAIEEKVRAEQDALRAENEKLKRVTQAEAAAREKELQADAEAYMIRVESTERAEAIRREAEALKGNRDLIDLRKIEKWDGRLPQIAGGDTIPLINIDNLTREGEN